MQLRRCILSALYRFFREYPYAQIELGELADICGADTRALNWNLVYLEKCGYVELAGSLDSAAYVACAASITAPGIDLIENKDAFGRRFCADGGPAPDSDASKAP